MQLQILITDNYIKFWESALKDHFTGFTFVNQSNKKWKEWDIQKKDILLGEWRLELFKFSFWIRALPINQKPGLRYLPIIYAQAFTMVNITLKDEKARKLNCSRNV